MNDIFNTYNNNSYMNTIKNDINLTVNLNIPVMNNIITNYFDKTYNIKKHGLTKFIKTLVNIYFNNITTNDIRPLILLGFNEIKPIHLTFNKDRLVDALILHHGKKHYDIILSEIVTGLSFNNRDNYAAKFRNIIQQELMKLEKFNDNRNSISNVYEINDKYYLLDLGEGNKTLHSSVKKYNINEHETVKSISDNKQKFNYIHNKGTVNNLITTINNKLKDDTLKDYIHSNSNYLLLVLSFAKELSEKEELLKQRKINFKKQQNIFIIIEQIHLLMNYQLNNY